MLLPLSFATHRVQSLSVYCLSAPPSIRNGSQYKNGVLSEITHFFNFCCIAPKPLPLVFAGNATQTIALCAIENWHQTKSDRTMSLVAPYAWAFAWKHRLHFMRTLLRLNLCVTLLYGGLATASVSDVVSTGRGSFVVSSQAQNGWSTRGAQKTKAYERAHSFCKARGKEMQTLHSRESAAGQVAFAEIEFSCVTAK